MRLLAFLPLLFAPLALADPDVEFFQDQTPLRHHRGDLSVPGDNPLVFCHDPKKDILTIEKVDLYPNPPLP